VVGSWRRRSEGRAFRRTGGGPRFELVGALVAGPEKLQAQGNGAAPVGRRQGQGEGREPLARRDVRVCVSAGLDGIPSARSLLPRVLLRPVDGGLSRSPTPVCKGPEARRACARLPPQAHIRERHSGLLASVLHRIGKDARARASPSLLNFSFRCCRRRRRHCCCYCYCCYCCRCRCHRCFYHCCRCCCCCCCRRRRRRRRRCCCCCCCCRCFNARRLPPSRAHPTPPPRRERTRGRGSGAEPRGGF
jgi:hypothetical protein